MKIFGVGKVIFFFLSLTFLKTSQSPGTDKTRAEKTAFFLDNQHD